MIFKKFYLEFEKIKDYLAPNFNSGEETHGFARLDLVIDEEQFERYSKGLSEIIINHGLEAHAVELLFVIFSENELLGEKLVDDLYRFRDTEKAIELSKFFLAFKTSQENPLFQIGVKVNSGTVNRPDSKNYFIQDEEISKWMCQIITDAVEKGNYPGGVFGDVWSESIAGYNMTGKQWPLRIEDLERGANLKAKSYNVLTNKRYVEFCFNLQYFLAVHTHLKTPKGVKMTDALATFLFDVLSTLQHIDNEKIGSDPKDYIATMIRNYKF